MATEAQIADALIIVIERQLLAWFAEVESIDMNPDRYGNDGAVAVPSRGTNVATPFRAVVVNNDRPIGTVAPTGGDATIEGFAAVRYTQQLQDFDDDDPSALAQLLAELEADNSVDIYTDTACILSQLGIPMTLRSVQQNPSSVPSTERLGNSLQEAKKAHAAGSP